MTKRKVVLAYSGGLDTSVILRWLQDHHQCEVITFTADVGQKEDLQQAVNRAESLGVAKDNIFVVDLKAAFVRDYVFPMLRANTLYEGEYLLGTAIARPLIAKALVSVARQVGADTISHGATGKGNDQVRFELGVYALAPEMRVIAPWRKWDLLSREKLLAYARAAGIPIDHKHQAGAPPYSMDANLMHISYEGLALEDPAVPAPEDMWLWTNSPEQAPDAAEKLSITFSQGDPVAINSEPMPAEEILERVNILGAKHGVGRLDLVENRYVGIKSRGCYETPGATILLKAHRAIESITLDREVTHLKDEIMPKYAHLIYNGYWWSPERECLQALIDQSQNCVSGTVEVALYKGNITILSRSSGRSLFNKTLASFDDSMGYHHQDAHGFIQLNALRLKLNAQQQKGS